MKDTYQDEAEIEHRLIDVLGEGRNQWTYRPDIKSEDALWENLRAKVVQNNLSELEDIPLTDKEFESIKLALLSKTQTPFEAAKWLKGENGIARLVIQREDTSLGELSLIIYSNREIGGGISTYEVVHQIAKRREHIDSRDRRFDVTLLINGLPIVQIELKKVTAKDGVYQAFNQIKKYAEEGLFKNNIFSTLQLFVVSNEQTTRYFANALSKDMHQKLLFSWRTSDNKKVDHLYEFCKQVLNIPDAHRLIAHYTIVSDDQDNKHLMVLHPYQIHAIEALFEAANKHQSGYVWHATGSGKTLTSFVATKLLAKKSGIDRTIMLVDRKALDSQTTREFTKFASEFNTGDSSGKGPENSLIIGTKDSDDLRQVLLSDANSDVIIVTTRQKLDIELRKAQKLAEQRGDNRFKKLIGQHIVFVVDECHRAISAKNMEDIKKVFPNSTWFGFTGTPIFEENKKQGIGNLARITDDQYGECLHTYTIKNALEDGAVLGFQVEHSTTIPENVLPDRIYHQFRSNPNYANYTSEELTQLIDQMDNREKEAYLKRKDFEDDDHVRSVIQQIFRPDNAYTKFDFRNGRPTKSAILTTHSIEMAKRYYHAIKQMTHSKNWIEETFPNHPLREGRSMSDTEFPRIAITYSLEENNNTSKKEQDEMQDIIQTYNSYYNTAWSISDIERYNGDINHRLARKSAAFQEFGQQIDLVIVVERLLTGFDSPTIQTLFVDKNLEYANLIQAFSRTNRTYPGKNKGLIVTFRKQATMEFNVAEATKLYSEKKEISDLIYPTYGETKKRFKKAFRKLNEIPILPEEIDEHTPLEIRIEYVKIFQEFSRAYESLVTYNEYNDDMEQSKALQEQVSILEKQVGIYQTIKGSLIEHTENQQKQEDFSDITFYSDASVKLYDIDSLYIDRLLGTYQANKTDVREEIERALQKLNKTEQVKEVYRSILSAIDSHDLIQKNDIFSLKRTYFTNERARHIDLFSQEWFVSIDELYSSAIQYTVGMEPIPNIGQIIESKNYEAYKIIHPKIKPFQYPQAMKRAWKNLLDNIIIPLENELR